MTAASRNLANGAGMAAWLGAGIGAFALGLVVLLNEAGAFSAPALYGPAGGVTGRTALGVVAWLIAWAVLHARWKERDVDAGKVHAAAIVLTLLGVLFCFPPLWGIF